MWLYVSAVVVGLALLVSGADRFVSGAAATARNLGLAPLTIGLTVIGVGTSAPEILVSAAAAWGHTPGVAIGNALGSNIANVGLVLGATALVAPPTVHSETLRREFPALVVVTGLAWLLLRDGALGRADGAVLLVGFAAVVGWMLLLGRTAQRLDPLDAEFEHRIPAGVSSARALAWVGAGLVALLLGSRAVVWGAVGIAHALGVSDLLIGLTVVAVGTSLPELAASITSVLKRQPDLAIGNLIGSNMFNLLPVLALPGLLAPGPLHEDVMRRDFPLMLAFTVALLLAAYGFGGRPRVARWEGALLLTAFCGYQGLLYLSSR